LSSPDVIVVGGGVIGCGIAYELRKRGLQVTVLERLRVGAGASAGAAGMLAPQVEAAGPGALLEMGLRSRALFSDWQAELPVSFDLDLSGILRVAHTERSAAELRRRAEWQRALGLSARLCDPAEVADLCPGLAPAVCGLWVPDGQLDARRLTLALAQGAAQRGATIREGVVVTSVRTGGVDTTEGRLSADHVVVAAGAWSGLLTGLPVRPVKGQRLLVRHAGRPLGMTAFGDHCYLVPKAGGHVLVGGTEEPGAGFDTRVTLDAVGRLSRAAGGLWPALGGAELVEAWAGLRPATPDRLPVLGRLPGFERVWVASGHYRNGILLSALTARLMAEAIVSGAALPAACAPERLHPRSARHVG
jgi:glycine oxidase